MNTKLGRLHVAEPPSSLLRLHHHDGRALKPVDHEPPLAVLDQEDLLAQGIHTSALIPGAKDVGALGSCVFNASTAHLSERLGESRFLGLVNATSYQDTADAERYAIKLYHETTDLTGDPASEWPPTDCGSSGLYACKELESQRVITGHKTAVGATNLASLLQDGTVIVGSPWFEAWFEPDAHGFVDGSGTVADLQRAVGSGVAGGHETCITAIEQIRPDASGQPVPEHTVLRVRNSWSNRWGVHGSYRIHLSTYVMLASHCDFRQMVA